MADLSASLQLDLTAALRDVDRLKRELGGAGKGLDQSLRGLPAPPTFAASNVGASKLSSTLRGLAAGVAAGAAVQFVSDLAGAASDLAESTNKAKVVFGESFGQIETFAEGAATAIGQSSRQAFEAAGTFGNLFSSVGITGAAAADFSVNMVTLGSDLGSFNNIPVDEALEKIRAGLLGEAEPLRSMGVFLSEAATKTKALELGLVDANGVMSESAKVQARYAIILEQTTLAQGDFARTADGLANTQKTLAARFEDVKAKVGEALLPVFTDVANIVIDDLLPVFEQLAEDLLPTLVEIFGAVAPAVASLVKAFGAAVEAAAPLLEVLEFTATLLPKLVGGAADLATGGFNILGEAVRDLTGNKDDLNATYEDEIDRMGGANRAMGATASAARVLADEQAELAEATERAVDAAKAQADAHRAAIDPLFKAQKGLHDARVAQKEYNDAVEEFGVDSEEARAAQDNLISAGLDAQGVVADLADKVRSGAASYADVSNAIDSLVEQGLFPADLASDAKRDLRGMLDQVLSVAGQAGAEGVGIGTSIGEGVAQGIDSMAPRVRSAAEELVLEAVLAGRGFIEAASPSRLFARLVGQPMGAGIAAGMLEARPLVAAATITTVQAGADAGLSGAVDRLTGAVRGARPVNVNVQGTAAGVDVTRATRLGARLAA